jgi:hypothetical protein
VEVILGAIASPPEYLDAETIRAMRDANGEPPCSDGLHAALEWIGDKRIKIDKQGIALATRAIGEEFVNWGLSALGIAGYGDGYGYGNGDGYGYGDGDGYGNGDGDGDGYGNGQE